MVKMNEVWQRNFIHALAAFIQEELPVSDRHSNEMNDEAWRLAHELESRFLAAFSELQNKQHKGE